MPLNTDLLVKAAQLCAAKAFEKTASPDPNSVTSAMGTGALGLGALGGLAGGLHGFLSPGEEEDENGKLVRRSRLSGALRGLAAGGAMGALGGAGLGYAFPRYLNFANTAFRMGTDPVNYTELAAATKGKPLPANMQMPQNLRLMHNTINYGPQAARALDPVPGFPVSYDVNAEMEKMKNNPFAPYNKPSNNTVPAQRVGL